MGAPVPNVSALPHAPLSDEDCFSHCLVKYYNEARTAQCPDGFLGDPVTIPAGTLYSCVSLEDANQQASALAEGQLNCTQVVWQSSEITLHCDPIVVPNGSGEFSFTSQALTAELIGFSELFSPSTPPRKYKRKDGWGDSSRISHYDACSGPRIQGSDRYLISGYDYYTEGGLLVTDNSHYTIWQKLGGYPPTDVHAEGAGLPDSLHYPTQPNDLIWTYTDTPTLHGKVPYQCAFTTTGAFSTPSGENWIELSNEDTEDDAIARATPTVGATPIASRTLRGAGQFTFTAVRVFATANLSGLQSGVEYTLTYNRTTTNTALGASVVELVGLTFTASGLTEALDLGEIPCAAGFSATVSDLEVVPVNSVIPGNSITVPAGRFTSTVSQEDADQQAADLAQAQLQCTPGCWNGDYRDRRYWAQIPVSATSTSGTDYYGALAPTLRFQGDGTYREICPTVCYCEGPVAEGVTVAEYLGRYETRWMALLIEGLIYYGRVDGTLIQVQLDLFPDPLSDTATHIALSFDANARPVFSYEDEGTIYVRRYVVDVPTTYSWIGTEPCLFFNGVINFDDSQTDVVCYYLTASGGGLYARLQRENFGVANLVIEDPGLDSLMAVDRGRGALASFMVVELSGKRIFAARYPAWPVSESDAVAASVACIGGIHRRVVVAVGAYGDSAASEIGTLTGTHRASVVTLPTASDSVASSIGVVTCAHKLVRVTLATESDPLASTIGPLTGVHKLVVIQAGTYNDLAASTTAPLTGIHRHV